MVFFKGGLYLIKFKKPQHEILGKGRGKFRCPQMSAIVDE